MKLYEAIANINKDEIETSYNVEVFSSIFNIHQCIDSDLIEDRLSEVYLIKWYCTDSYVGTKVYFLDGIPVAISTQNGRKSDEDIYFLSDSDAERMHRFILEITKENISYSLCNLDAEIGETYNVDYGSQLLTEQGFYKGYPAFVQKTYNMYSDIDKWSLVEIQYFNGQSNVFCEIPLSEFDIPLNTLKQSKD